MKCNSCVKGYDGTNGNGYQPCGCDKLKDEAIPKSTGKNSKPAYTTMGKIKTNADNKDIVFDNFEKVMFIYGVIFGSGLSFLWH